MTGLSDPVLCSIIYSSSVVLAAVVLCFGACMIANLFFEEDHEEDRKLESCIGFLNPELGEEVSLSLQEELEWEEEQKEKKRWKR